MKKAVDFSFLSVYEHGNYVRELFYLLKERTQNVNISHKKLPSFKEHKRFVESRPYRIWNFIIRSGTVIGSVYVTHRNEIGLFIFKKFRGMGFEGGVLDGVLKTEGRLLANINPRNKRSVALFKSRGFKLIQNTYEKIS